MSQILSQQDKHATKAKGKDKVRTVPTGFENSDRPVKKLKAELEVQRKGKVVCYDAPKAFEETTLYTKLHGLDSDGQLTRYFKYARKLHLELGSCAADLLWRKALLGNSSEAGEGSLKAFQDLIQNWDFVLPNALQTSTRYNVSSQVANLVDVLRSSDTHVDSFRGVIIVKRPVTACMIEVLLRMLDNELPHIRPAALVTSSPIDNSQHEAAVLSNFSLGICNLLMTNRLNEKLDLPPITTIIHFNPLENGPKSLLAQSLTSTNPTCTVVYMVEQGDEPHTEILKSRRTQSRSPEPTRHDLPENDSDILMVLDDDNSIQYVEEPATGKKITVALAPLALQRYLSMLQSLYPGEEHGSRSWCDLDQPQHKSLTLRLMLPENISLPQPLRRLAARASQGATPQQCHPTCKELFYAGLLGDQFFFAPHETGHGILAETDGHEVKTANLSANTRCYPRKKPSFWTRSLQSTSSRLYPLIVSINLVDSFKDGRHIPMVILTRYPLPKLESFSTFSSGQRATVQLQAGAPVEVDAKKQELLLKYTLRIARALKNKPLECTIESLLYFFAPLDSAWDPAASDLAPWLLPNVDRHIAWHQVTEAADHWASKLVSEDEALTEESVQDYVIQDRAVEFTNRHFVMKLRHDLSPHSKMEQDNGEEEAMTYLDHCKARVKDFQGLKDEQQSLLEVSLVPPVANSLAPSSKAAPTEQNPARLFIPELCYRFVIPASTWRTAILLPSITHMIDRMLLAKEMRVTVFDEHINEDDLLSAMTPTSASVEKDYERLELLGDTLLKNILSTYFFVTIPDKREGALNAARAQAVSNKTLHLNAMAAGVPPWIQGKPLIVKLWAPYILVPAECDAKGSQEAGASSGQRQTQGKPRRSKQQKQVEEQDVQWLGDKTVADVVEAIVGAAFLNNGIENALRVMHVLRFNMPEISEYSDFWRLYAPHAASHKTLHKLPTSTIKTVEEITGYEFHASSLLAEALTHGSVPGQQIPSYDRLEFLGDGVLDFHVVWYAFKAYPSLSPGGLSLLKAAMVSNSTLAAIAVLSGLHEHVRCSSKGVVAAIKLYAQKIQVLREQEHRDAEAEGRLPNQFWLDLDAPKILADLVEAIIGAIYVSDQFGTQGVGAFFQKILQPFYERHIRLHTLATHPSKSLFELLQADGCQQHTMRKINLGKEVRSEVVIHETILVSVVEPTSNLSMRKAATAALDALANDATFIARVCDCKTQKPANASKKAQKKQQQQGYDVDA